MTQVLVYSRDEHEDGQFVQDWDTPLSFEKQTIILKPSEAVRQGKEVDICAVCQYQHLHLRKDFPRVLGLSIVGVAAVSMFFIRGPLFPVPLLLASLLDFLLYQWVPWKIVCYVCDAEYRGYQPRDEQQEYDLETATECQRLRWPKKPEEPAQKQA